MKQKNNFRIRATALITAIIFVTSVFCADLFRIQIVEKEKYTSKKLSLSSTVSKIPAVRGEILDSSGKPLVYNSPSNTVYFDAAYFPKASSTDKRNSIVLSLIKLFESMDIPYSSNLPIEYAQGKFVFKENSDSDKAYLISKDYLNLNVYATAQNCFDAIVEYYSLGGISQEEALKTASVYFAMRRADFSTLNPFTFAENVPEEAVLILKEQSRFYEGVEVRIDTVREYYDGTIAPHIVGYYDFLNADEYKAVTEQYNEKIANNNLTDDEKADLKLRSYAITDKIGKFGIESAMEETLRGKNGIMTTVTNADGTKTRTVTTEPENGGNVILTFNADFQKSVQNILFSRIELLKDKSAVDVAGSMVVLDVNDFSVLACATYPSYDLSTYKENIVKLNTDKSAPLWNRALRSTYAPGSTVKPAIALAGLEEGIVTPDTGIMCNVLYTYFSGPPFKCYNNNAHAGSEQTVETAIRNSCNTYFYEVGRQLGISKMDDYLYSFGLGRKTGVELTEAEGVIAGPEERKAAGGIWYPGDVVQAAIGQSDHLFTPIQLAAYAATLANGGIKYRAHFVKAVKSADYSQTVYEVQPEIINKLNISDSSKAAVKKGMVSLGNSYLAFKELPYEIACKTGTAQIKKKINGVEVEYTNGFMIAYAPADNPKIAIAVSVENSKSGEIVNCVAEICKAYFENNSGVTPSQTGGNVLR